MAKYQTSRTQSGNKLLARLPPAVYERLLPHLTPLPLQFKQVLYGVRSAVDHAYFPLRGVLSALTVMKDGRAIEVATIGNEGMIGLPASIEAKNSPNKVLVQIAGDGLRIKASMLMDETRQSEPLRRLLALYQSAFMSQLSQSVACNGLHSVQKRCCRWLLITHDRLASNEVPLTHEFLAIMLGARRSSVTEVLQPLQEQGLVHNARGVITILDRAGLEAACCECYRSVADEFHRLLG